MRKSSFAARTALMGAAVVLAAICLASGAAATGPKKFKRGTKIVEFTEIAATSQKSTGPKGPSKRSRSDGAGGASEPAPTRPDKFDQGVLDGVTTIVGTNGTSGRKLLALGDSCTVTLKNACRSKKSFRAAFGYFTWNGVDGQSGWVSEGTWTIRSGRSLRFLGQQTLYFATNSGLRPTRTATKPATFCVSTSPYTIFLGNDDDYYYTIDDDTNTVTDSGYFCYEVGGWLRSDFYSPVLCGLTFTFQAC